MKDSNKIDNGRRKIKDTAGEMAFYSKRKGFDTFAGQDFREESSSSATHPFFLFVSSCYSSSKSRSPCQRREVENQVAQSLYFVLLLSVK